MVAASLELVGDDRPVIVPPEIVAVLIVGLVKVLLVRVCVPVSVATPVRVLLAALIVLLVSV